MDKGKKDSEDHGKYVRKVQHDTQRYIQNLLAEEEKLLNLLATVENEKKRLETENQQISKENEKIKAKVKEVENERLNLQEQLTKVLEDLNSYKQEQNQLKQQMNEVKEESLKFSEQYLDVEQQNSNLANLYVASYSLHGTLDRESILNTIQEIVINLIGSEEVGIFELDSDNLGLSLVSSFGIDTELYQTIPLKSSLIGHSALSGETYLASKNNSNCLLPQEANLTACIPLKLQNQVTGVIAIFQLLPQKTDLIALDNELFDLLATHAATALYCAKLHAQLTGEKEQNAEASVMG